MMIVTPSQVYELTGERILEPTRDKEPTVRGEPNAEEFRWAWCAACRRPSFSHQLAVDGLSFAYRAPHLPLTPVLPQVNRDDASDVLPAAKPGRCKTRIPPSDAAAATPPRPSPPPHTHTHGRSAASSPDQHPGAANALLISCRPLLRSRAGSTGQGPTCGSATRWSRSPTCSTTPTPAATQSSTRRPTAVSRTIAGHDGWRFGSIVRPWGVVRATQHSNSRYQSLGVLYELVS